MSCSPAPGEAPALAGPATITLELFEAHACGVDRPPPPPRPRPGRGRSVALAIDGPVATAVARLPGRALRRRLEHDWQQDAQAQVGIGLQPEPCRSLLRVNDGPDVDLALAINPYRGCSHACVFCHAEPAAAGGAPMRLQVKVNAADRLREELRRPNYRPRPISLGSDTDAYQPAEHPLRLTRALIEVLHEAGHPLAITTRSAGIVRDLDLLAPMAARGQVRVLISLATLDEGLCRALEPGASPPADRLAALRLLAAAGVPVGLNLSPLMPGVNEHGIETLVEAAARAGARSLHWTVLQRPACGLAALGDAVDGVQAGRPVAAGAEADGDPALAPLALQPQWLDLDPNPDPDEPAAAQAGPPDPPDPRWHGRSPWAQALATRLRQVAQRLGLALEAPALDGRAFVAPRLAVDVRRPVDPQGELF
ncbi:radical SAM family protein [Sphaerotilus hippei]|uniref:Radical SAM family protein n=1 Tax=Sphaerotilus hippei TaxID=744406 RepID=A0A318H552_9BURK|nr:radical SAM protein [Sphaerotilus hippei]PXW98816.1 radical SAM family protein [Sphaerotilus hippei]